LGLDQVNEPLAFTGERFVPGVKGEIWVEHWHRYHFARRWAEGKRVLDVACGEGYGSALLARGAAHVTGVDVSEEAIAHARGAYSALGNVAFERASCTQLPLAAGSVDVAVSFETIEHIAEQEAFLAELARVLSPGGVLVLSCPNRAEYSDRRGFDNPFHVKELYRAELAQLLAARLPETVWYGQRPTFFSLIAPEQSKDAAGELVEVDEENPAEATSALASPLYFLVVASRSRAALESAPPVLSVLSDRGDWVHRDYEKVMNDLVAASKRKDELERQVIDSRRAIDGLKEEALSLQHARDELRDALAEREAALSRREIDVAQRDETIAARDREVLRRRGWRWWLRLPFVRLGLMKE
jgi:ubiquinone/menaquinone biosynthesis C-methylase UbiE